MLRGSRRRRIESQADTLDAGLVRAPLFTTAMQVASRLLLVWGIGYAFPQTTRFSPAYSSMLLAWSVTEVIRYGYFALALSASVPRVWTWLRYVSLSLFPLPPIPLSPTSARDDVSKERVETNARATQI